MLKITQLVLVVGVFLASWVAALQRDLTPNTRWVVQAVRPNPCFVPARDRPPTHFLRGAKGADGVLPCLRCPQWEAANSPRSPRSTCADDHGTGAVAAVRAGELRAVLHHGHRMEPRHVSFVSRGGRLAAGGTCSAEPLPPCRLGCMWIQSADARSPPSCCARTDAHRSAGGCVCRRWQT